MKTFAFTLVMSVFFSNLATGQVITTIAGTGVTGSSGDGGVASAATFNQPAGTYFDVSGNLYVVEYSGQKIRKINSAGIVSLFAGNGTIGSGGDGGPATAASFYYPIDLAADAAGNVYIIDNTNHKIRKVNPAGIITTYAGTGIAGYSGDGGPATAAKLNNPSRMCIDASGNLFFADAVNNAIRKINTAGIITTVAGTGVPGFSGDGGQATAATLHQPLGVAFDANGNMYIADALNRRIRKVTPGGIISTYAGTGVSGTTGDSGPAAAATMIYPNGVATDITCNVYFTDWNGHTVRKISGTTGIITTVVGTPSVPGFSGDGGAATLARLNGPDNLAFDNAMNLYIPDFYNNRVRKVANLGEMTACPPLTPLATFSSTASSVCQDSCVTFVSTSSGTIDSIRWVTILSGTYASAATSNPATICFANPGSYTVRLRVYGGGVVDSVSSTITVAPSPHPAITQSGATLSVTGSYAAYQWYNSGLTIAGATTSAYTYTAPGIFSVVVDSGGCKGSSAAISVLGAGVQDLQHTVTVSGASGHTIVLRSLVTLGETFNVSVHDLMGREVIHDYWDQGTDTKIMNMGSALPEGIYVVSVRGHAADLAAKVYLH